MIGKSISFNSFVLGAFALCTAGVVALTFEATREKIDQAKLRAAQAALTEIIPLEEHDNNLFGDTLAVLDGDKSLLGLSHEVDQDKVIHIARKNDNAIAAIIPTVAKDGYSGDIKMLLGVYANGRIAGLRVTDHNETPGLGDAIDVKKSNWILSFDGKSQGANFDDRQQINPATGETFDQLTGATITRKAVTRQVERTLAYFESTSPLTISSSTPSTSETPEQ